MRVEVGSLSTKLYTSFLELSQNGNKIYYALHENEEQNKYNQKTLME